MQVIDLLRREGQAPFARLTLSALAAGVGCAALLGIASGGARTSPQDGPDLALLVIFVTTLLLYLMVQRYVLRTMTAEVEAAVRRIRLRMIAKALRCEIPSLEAVGRPSLYSAIATDAEVIATSAKELLVGAQSLIVIACIVAYIGFLSLAAFFFVLAAGAFALFLYVRQLRRTRALTRRALAKEEELRQSVSALLDGFKEIKLSTARAAAVEADFAAVSQEAAESHSEAGRGLGDGYLLAQLLLFGMLGVLIFIVPGLEQIEPEVLAQLVVVMLFVIGPAAAVTIAIPRLLTVEASAEKLRAIEAGLDAQLAVEPGVGEEAPAPTRPWPPFKRLTLNQLYFRHRSDEEFAVGPINLSIGAGETVFITGGTGSGKSTLLKLLAGLYFPDAGTIAIDGRPVRRAEVQAWREQVAAVFADYHLFPRLHGIAVDPNAAAALLEEMEIDDKTMLAGDRFEPLPLAAGQRKRLALVSAILEARPLLLLDEFASDQEPHFRQKFYEEVLPGLRRRGIAVIAATDDERWFSVADRRIRLEDGKMIMAEGTSDG